MSQRNSEFAQFSHIRRNRAIRRAASIELLEQRTLLSITFGSPVEYDSMRGPAGIASADFNGDGKADIVVVGSTGLGGRESTGKAAVATKLNNGDGTFGSPTFTASADGNVALSVVTADFNHDGKMDFAVASPGSNSIDVYLGNGDGTFAAATPTRLEFASAEQAGSSMAVADLNQDGKPDLLIANAGTVAVLLGNGDGTFQSAAAVAIGDAGPEGFMKVVAGDFNGDGKIDFASVIDGSSNVYVANGNGTGGFSAPHTYALSGTPDGLIAADVNGDGKTDLIVPTIGPSMSDISDSAVQVLLNSGSSFSLGTPITNTGGQPLVAPDLTAGDFDGDGKIDLVADDGQGGLYVMPGNGDGTFQPVQHLATVQNVGPHFNLIAADFDGDGKLDLADLTYAELGATGGMEIMIQGAPRAIGTDPIPVQPPITISPQPPVVVNYPILPFVAGKHLSKKIRHASGTSPQMGAAKLVIATAGESSSAILGTFKAPSSTTSGSQLTANINWGDGEASDGVIEVPQAGQFSVNGTHIYAKIGHYNVTVDVVDGSRRVATIHTRAIVLKNSSAGRTIHADVGKAFDGVVALYDTRGDSPSVGDLTIDIDWGDGSGLIGGTLKKKTGRWEFVYGTHTYATAGTYRIKIVSIIQPMSGMPGTATPPLIAVKNQAFSTAIVR